MRQKCELQGARLRNFKEILAARKAEAVFYIGIEMDLRDVWIEKK